MLNTDAVVMVLMFKLARILMSCKVGMLLSLDSSTWVLVKPRSKMRDVGRHSPMGAQLYAFQSAIWICFRCQTVFLTSAQVGVRLSSPYSSFYRAEAAVIPHPTAVQPSISVDLTPSDSRPS